MKRAVIIDGPECATDAEALVFLRALGVPDGLDVRVFREATRLAVRIRITDWSGAVPWLDEVPEATVIPVIRPDQLFSRIARTACPS